MTLEEQKLEPKEEKTKPKEIEIVSEQKWDKKKIPVNKSAFRLQFVSVIIFFILLLIPGISVLFMLFETDAAIVLSILLVIAFVFLLFLFFLLYLSNNTLEYEAESGKIYKLDESLLGGLQGKLVVKRGLIGKNTQNLPMSEFDRVSVVQDPLGKIMNYGTLVLEQVDTLQKTQNIRLPYVRNPQKYGPLLQKMVDLAKRKPLTPMPSGMENQ